MTKLSIDLVCEWLAQCSPDELEALFQEVRQRRPIHPFEEIIGAPAEMILEAVHRAPELTRRMLRGVIADAAFRTFVVPGLQSVGWQDATPEGNFAFDYKLVDPTGPVTVQVKLQRSLRGSPVVNRGVRYGFEGDVYMVETQKTRTGSIGIEQTRPYRYGEFDIIAVSMQPSSGDWGRFMYAPARWLIAAANPELMATMQPVAMTANQFWTDSFVESVERLRAADPGPRMAMALKRR